MLNRLRTVVNRKPVIIGAVLLLLYLLGGFLALPAIVKWQVEKQVPEQLGHAISVGKLRFNPLLFRFEVEDLALADPSGQPMLGFKRLLVDFELRSIIDRAWTFAEARLEAPVLHFSLDKDGRHNFASLLERLPASAPDQEDEGLPRFIVQRVALSDGRIEFSDQLLEDPLVAQIEPLLVEIDNLSSLPEQAGSYRLSARTAADEAVDSNGELSLNPIASKGKLTLSALQVATLVRSLPRLLAIDSPAGTVAMGASFDLAVDAAGTLAGAVQDLEVDIAALSLSAAGASSPLLAIDTLSLKQGQVDLAARQANLADFRLAKGSVDVAFDDDGTLNWEKLVRVKTMASAPQEKAETTDKAEAVATPKTQTVVAPEAATVGASGEAVAPAKEAPEAAVPKPWRLVVKRAEISAVEFAYADPAQALAIDVGALAFEAAPSVEFAAAGTQVELALPKLSLSGARLKSGADTLAVPDGLIAAGKIAMLVADAGFDLTVDQAQASLDGVKAQSGVSGVELGKLAIASEKLSLAQTEAGIRIDAGAAQVSLVAVAAQQGADRITWQDAVLDVREIAAVLGGGSSASSELDLRFEDVATKLNALGVIALGASSEIAHVATTTLGAKSLRFMLSDGPVDVRGESLSGALSNALFRSAGDGSEMLRLGRGTLSGGSFGLKGRMVSVDKLVLADGVARTWLDGEGRFNGMALTRGAVAAASAAASAAEGPPASSQDRGPDAEDAAWRIAVKSAEVDAFALGFEDRRGGPQLAVGLESIRARIAGFETGVTTPMQVEFRARLVSGGDVEAKGSVRADNGTSDLQLSLAAIALAPVQPYLSEFAELNLASGTLSTAGRLRYGDPAAAGAQLAYKGSFAVNKLRIDEVEPKRPFVTWDELATDELLLTVEPNRMDVGELRLVAPAGRLIIAEDQSVNLTDVLKKPRDGEAAPEASDQASEQGAAGAPEVAAGDEGANVEDPFPVTIARIRVSRGALEFADLSLRPQFGTRMHELKGVVTGLGTDPNRSAKVQLDARVDKYGSAKIRGQISVLRPAKLTDIEMTFRNLTMSSLSPYVVKFAGRRIEGGQLALDLQYKVKDSKLRGENKIVLKQVKLGEKVDSPGAADLPLDLAIAILSDSQGVIDIGLPVSGDLDDPEFGYGAVIGKAFGNLITGIITAPFKALGALFGAGSDSQLDSIDFEPGSAVVAPPEREKLAAVARAMKERPTLQLVVPPVHSAEADTPALKSLAVRSDIVARMGLELKPGEDPGPVDAANPRAQAAIEAVFSERYAPEVLALVKQRAIAAAPAGKAGSESPTAQPPAAQPPAGPPTAFYQGLLDRMVKEQSVSEEALAQLATRRGEAIVAEMTGVDGVDAKRVVLGKARPASAASDKAVTLALELEVAR